MPHYYLFDPPVGLKILKTVVFNPPNGPLSFPYKDFHLPPSFSLFSFLCPPSCQLVTAFLPLFLAYPTVLHDLHRSPIFLHTYLIIHTLFVFLRQILSHSKYLSFTLSRQNSLSDIMAKSRQ